MAEAVAAQDIREAKRKYHREWRRTHPENVRAAQMRYWMRKAAQMQAETRSAADDQDPGQQAG